MENEAINKLRSELASKNLTLFLGAGVSIDNNLPSWDKLVLAMYFSKISEQYLGGWRPFSNYLYAIAEWQLANSTEPLEITSRKLQKYYQTGDNGQWEFINHLYHTLYGSMLDNNGHPYQDVDKQLLRSKNATLNAVAHLCEAHRKRIHSVISYNYDNLLEIALGNLSHQSIFEGSGILDIEKLPIYHVHGYVPLHWDGNEEISSEIIFTEDQYHRISGDPYNWANLVQLQSMSNTVGLMIGLSLSDRNMRRLLDAVKNAPIKSSIFALLKIPDETPPKDEVLDEIHESAIEYLNKFRNSGIKSEQGESSRALFHRMGVKSSGPAIKSSRSGEKGPAYRSDIAAIIEQVKILERDQQQYVLNELGITPIWFEKYSEIPGIINQIM